MRTKGISRAIQRSTFICFSEKVNRNKKCNTKFVVLNCGDEEDMCCPKCMSLVSVSRVQNENFGKFNNEGNWLINGNTGHR